MKYYLVSFLSVMCGYLLCFYTIDRPKKFETNVYSVVCVDNVSYVIFDSGAATVKKDLKGYPELCDLDE